MRNDTIVNQRTRNLCLPPAKAVGNFTRYKTNITAMGLLFILSGCASVGNLSQTTGTPDNAQQLRADMVTDLLSVLPQILEPLNTTVQVSDSESGQAIDAANRLSELGYGLQRVDADQGSNFLYVVDLPGSDQSKTRLRVTIGNLELTRSYQVIQEHPSISDAANLIWRDDRAVVPTGPLTLAGTRQTIELLGTKVELAGTDGNGAYEFSTGTIQYAALAPIEGGIPTISLITEDIVQRVSDSASAGPSYSSVRPGRDQFGNLFNGDPSVFASIFDDYNRIIREFVIFPNDSQKLGQPGKVLVNKLVSRFSENSDIIGIIGCSNGPTGLEIGNEGLALGRAKRITDELVAAGISRDRVYDEGCWSPSTGADGFPNRGVVIDLWRRAG